jgi:hypothetical protein
VALRSTLRPATVICICAGAAGGTHAQEPVNPTAATVADFQQRVKDYMGLHDKAAKGLPSPTKDATPAEIVQQQRELESRLLPLRHGVKPGNVFTPDMQAFLRKYLGQVFSGPEGRKLKSAVMDENPVYVKYAVNSRYPDTVPLSTMPAQVLQALPRLPDGLEYRFIGRDLILLDVRAHLVVDFVRDVIPA